MAEDCCLFTRYYVNVRVCNLHKQHHTGHIENLKQNTADLQLVALFPSHLVLVNDVLVLVNNVQADSIRAKVFL